MTDHFQIEKINKFVMSNEWFEFEVFSYIESVLTIIGGVDLIYYHTLEIVFKNVFLYSGVTEWSTDTSAPMLGILTGEELRRFNLDHQVEGGNTVFFIKSEYHKNKIYIVAESLEFDCSTVKHGYLS